MSLGINSYPAIKYANKIEQICHPLFAFTPITAMSLHRIYDDTDYIGFYSNQQIATMMLQRGYIDKAIFTYLKAKDHSSDFMLWNASGLKTFNELTRSLFADLYKLNARCGITIVEKYQNYRQLYCFSCDNTNGNEDEYLLEHIDSFKIFLLHFKEKIAKDKTLSHVLNEGQSHTIRLNHAASKPFITPNLSSNLTIPPKIQINRFYLNNGIKDISFTKRDIEFLTLIAMGHSNNEIANKLFLSPKSIESRLLSLRRKTGAANKRELLQYFMLCPESQILLKKNPVFEPCKLREA